MSHTKPAAASDPAFDFTTDEAPLDLALLREHDYGRSLMDRAQRQRKTSEEFRPRAQALLQQAATSSLPQETQLAALDQQAQQLADAERTQTGYRRLRERYDPAELDRSLQAIATIADPAQQRASLTQLQGSYAGFAFNPEIARRMDAQFAEFEPVVQRREQASLRAAIATGRYASTLSAARQTYPGWKINTLYDPESRATVFVPEKFADPDLEAEAVQVIQNGFHLAQVTGDRTHLEAALDDDAVRHVSRIPGNRASTVFERALEALSAPAITPAPAPASVPANADTEVISPSEPEAKADYSRNERSSAMPASPAVDQAPGTSHKEFERFMGDFSAAKKTPEQAAAETEYRRYTEGAVAGPKVPWDAGNPRYLPRSGTADAEEAKGKVPFLGKILTRSLKLKPQDLIANPTRIGAYVRERTTPLYTRDLVKDGQVIDVIYGLRWQEAGQSDMLRRSVDFEISGLKNGAYLRTTPLTSFNNGHIWPKVQSEYQVSPWAAIDPKLLD